MPGLSEHPGVKKAIYMTQNEPDNLEEAIRVGTKGFYVKRIDPRTERRVSNAIFTVSKCMVGDQRLER